MQLAQHQPFPYFCLPHSIERVVERFIRQLKAYQVLERSTHFFLLQIEEKTGKVSTLRLKPARTPADIESAQRPRGQPRQVTFTLQPATLPSQHQHYYQASLIAKSGHRHDSTSEPAAAEFGGGPVVAYPLSPPAFALARHVTIPDV
jgi:hypothetical protein